MKSIPEEYRESLQKIISAAHEFLLEGNEIIKTVSLAKFTEKSLINISLESLSSDKNEAVFIVREFVKKLQPDYIIFSAETWVVDKTDLSEDEIQKIRNEGTQNHPDRKEMMLFTLETHNGFWIGMGEIKNLKDNKRDFNKPEFIQSEKIEGRYFFFPSDDETKH